MTTHGPEALPAPAQLWNDAHTGYGPNRQPRRAPRGLAANEMQWRDFLTAQTPNGWLLHSNALLEMLTSSRPIHLMHTTTYLEQIRASRQLYQAAGCLVGALYCAPLTLDANGLRPHNLGAWLLESKPHTDTLIFETTSSRPTPTEGIDYLRLGSLHLHAYLQHRSFLTEEEDARLRGTAVAQVARTATFLDQMLAGACGAALSARQFLDQLTAAIGDVPFLGYLYFEVVAEYLMLHSTSDRTAACAEVGELNNRLYKDLAFNAVDTMGHLFDLALFRPSHDRLCELVGYIEPGLVAGVADYTARRLPHLFACTTLGPDIDTHAATFHQDDFEALSATAPGLMGQMVFRLLRTSPRYPQLFPIIEQAKATAVSAYWNARQMPAPFNGVIPKGEIGLNIAWPTGVRAWVARTDDHGLLHPSEELDLTLVPRLADLRETALGRAQFALPTSGHGARSHTAVPASTKRSLQ
ncbi:hypothetical protein [Nocardiopsis coralliicola]